MVAVLEPVGLTGLPVGGVTGVVASSGICCTSSVRLGVVGFAGVVTVGSELGLIGVAMVGSTAATTASLGG